MLGIEMAMSTAHHPQTDGQTERTNQELEQYLRCYVKYNQNDWDNYLGTAEYAYNNREHSTIKMSPFKAVYGRNMNMDIQPQVTEVPAASDYAKCYKTITKLFFFHCLCNVLSLSCVCIYFSCSLMFFCFF